MKSGEERDVCAQSAGRLSLRSFERQGPRPSTWSVPEGLDWDFETSVRNALASAEQALAGHPNATTDPHEALTVLHELHVLCTVGAPPNSRNVSLRLGARLFYWYSPDYIFGRFARSFPVRPENVERFDIDEGTREYDILSRLGLVTECALRGHDLDPDLLYYVG